MKSHPTSNYSRPWARFARPLKAGAPSAARMWFNFTAPQWNSLSSSAWSRLTAYISRATVRRWQIAVDQPQGGVNYPFVAPSDGLEEVIGDLHLTYRDDDNLLGHPFSIAWLYNFAANAPADGFDAYSPAKRWRELLLVDAHGTTVFDTRTASYTTRPWGNRCVLHEWLQSDAVLRIAEYWSQNADDATITLPTLCTPTDGTLDDRACIQQAVQLRSLRVGLNQVRGLGSVFQAGYNMQMVVTPITPVDGGRLQTQVSFSAIPSSGAGTYNPGPPAYIGIRKINGIKPDTSGNFGMDATACYRVERPVQEVLNTNPREVAIIDHALQVFADCGPCCECQDFINVYEAIRRLRNRYADLIARAQAARDTYMKNRKRFMEQAACRAADSLRIRVNPQCPRALDIAVGYCNHTGKCLHNVYLTIDFAYDDGTTVLKSTGPDLDNAEANQVTCASTYRNGNVQGASKLGNSFRTSSRLERYDLGGQWPHYWAYFDAVDPGALASITSRFHFTDAKSSWNIVVTVDAYVLDHPAPITPGQSPIPGHVLGQGPVDEQGQNAHLVSHVVSAQSGLMVAGTEEGCCNTGDTDIAGTQFQGKDSAVSADDDPQDPDGKDESCVKDSFDPDSVVSSRPSVDTSLPGYLLIRVGSNYDSYQITVVPEQYAGDRTRTVTLEPQGQQMYTACPAVYQVQCHATRLEGTETQDWAMAVIVPHNKYAVVNFDL